MNRRFTRLAWAAAISTYLLIIFGAIVRITGSGLGCGEHWPLCNGSLLPPLDLPTMIEYGHRLIAAALTVLVLVLAAYARWLRADGRADGRFGGSAVRESAPERSANPPIRPSVRPSARPSTAAYIAVALLILQIALGAITVKLDLPAWTVILHLGTAMALLAVLLYTAREPNVNWPSGVALGAAALGFVTVLFGALTANMGAAFACLGFPLCNGQAMPTGGMLQHVHWTHRLLAYGLTAYMIPWAITSRRPAPRYVLLLVIAQVAVAASMVLLSLPKALQAVHVAVGAAVWAGLVLAAL